jgi:predicted O-linked N-acetylglucosamine transferase (SPINDLY family)
MGADYIDYIIADSIVIPAESRKYYTEKVIYLPNSYQVNDDSREISNQIFSKEQLQLPDKGFIYCCFNNNYKITPEVFSIWSEILHAVDGSVLWLLGDTEIAERNLRQSAINEGLNPNRIIFAKRISTEQHLSRHKLADLFLDTSPYNAHTTASDSLWSGIPLLTKFGNSFAARVAASLLKSVDLPELITYSDSEYIEKAIYFAKNKDELYKIKNKLSLNRDKFPLFNTSLFCKNIEKSFKEIYKRKKEGKRPDHIFI